MNARTSRLGATERAIVNGIFDIRTICPAALGFVLEPTGEPAGVVVCGNVASVWKDRGCQLCSGQHKVLLSNGNQAGTDERIDKRFGLLAVVSQEVQQIGVIGCNVVTA